MYRDQLHGGTEAWPVYAFFVAAVALVTRRQEAAKGAWEPSDLPEWLNGKAYRERIMPRLVTAAVRTVMEALQISKPYAVDIRSGKRVPHPRHWEKLARLVDSDRPE